MIRKKKPSLLFTFEAASFLWYTARNNDQDEHSQHYEEEQRPIMNALIKPLLPVELGLLLQVGILVIGMRSLGHAGPDIKDKADEGSDRAGDRKYYQDSKKHECTGIGQPQK
jgi:hypothetical protein